MAINGKSRKYKKKNNFQPNSEAQVKSDGIDLIMEKLKGLGFGEKADKSPDTSDMGIIIHELVKAVNILRQKVEDLESKSATSDEGLRNREANDEIDEIKQRQLKGSLLLSCSKADTSSPSLIKSDEELGSCPLIDHVTDIINKKYKVKVPKEDVQACHRLPSGSIIIKIWRRTNASPWQSLINSIRTGGDKKINCFLNFHLTKTRNNLLYEVRQLKKKNIITTFSSDENGSIYIQKKEDDKKMRITTHYGKKGEKCKTYTVSELKALVGL